MKGMSLQSELVEHNEFFDHIVDMISERLYIAGNSGDDYNPKYYKGQSNDSKEARRAQNKVAKRKKLNPSLSESTVKSKKRIDNGGGQSSDSDDSDDNSDVENTNNSNSKKTSPIPTKGKRGKANDNNGNNKQQQKKEKNDTTSQQQDNNGGNNNKKSRIDLLREKLHAKIAEKSGNRPSDPNSVSKRAARRAEKQRRREQAAARSKKSHTKVNGGGSSRTTFTASTVSESIPDASQDLENMDFGRLTGLNASSNDNYEKSNKSLAKLSKKKNLEKILADAEQKKERLEQLKQSSEPADREKADQMLWSDALKEASGTRVKDDPAKIRNAIKKKQVKKKKSAKAWKSRMDQTKDKMNERLKIRSHNLEARRKGGKAGANLSKKGIDTGGTDETEGKRKRLSRPGFEGRKEDFINNKKHQ